MKKIAPLFSMVNAQLAPGLKENPEIIKERVIFKSIIEQSVETDLEMPMSLVPSSDRFHKDNILSVDHLSHSKKNLMSIESGLQEMDFKKCFTI